MNKIINKNHNKNGEENEKNNFIYDFNNIIRLL